jgi:hypothetical protein
MVCWRRCILQCSPALAVGVQISSNILNQAQNAQKNQISLLWPLLGVCRVSICGTMPQRVAHNQNNSDGYKFWTRPTDRRCFGGFISISESSLRYWSKGPVKFQKLGRRLAESTLRRILLSNLVCLKDELSVCSSYAHLSGNRTSYRSFSHRERLFQTNVLHLVHFGAHPCLTDSEDCKSSFSHACISCRLCSHHAFTLSLQANTSNGTKNYRSVPSSPSVSAKSKEHKRLQYIAFWTCCTVLVQFLWFLSVTIACRRLTSPNTHNRVFLFSKYEIHVPLAHKRIAQQSTHTARLHHHPTCPHSLNTHSCSEIFHG